MQRRELELAIAYVWGQPLPDDDCGRSLLRLLVEYLPFSGHSQIAVTVARWAPWMEAPEIEQIEIEAATTPPRYRTADELAAEIGLTFEIRQRLALKSIGAVDLGKDARKRRRREVKAEAERARRARRRLEKSLLRQAATAAHQPSFDRPERQEAIRAVLLSKDWTSVRDICGTVSGWPAFEGLSARSLRVVVLREVKAMAADGTVTTQVVPGRGGANRHSILAVLTEKLEEAIPIDGNTSETRSRGQR